MADPTAEDRMSDALRTILGCAFFLLLGFALLALGISAILGWL